MGDKIQARKLAEKSGVPVVPGEMKSIKNLNEARKSANKIGYPILVKAAAGGGWTLGTEVASTSIKNIRTCFIIPKKILCY